MDNLNPNIYKEWKLVWRKDQFNTEVKLNYDGTLQFFTDGTYIYTMNYKDGTNKVQKGVFEFKNKGKKIKFMTDKLVNYKVDVYNLTNTSVEITDDTYTNYYKAK